MKLKRIGGGFSAQFRTFFKRFPAGISQRVRYTIEEQEGYTRKLFLMTFFFMVLVYAIEKEVLNARNFIWSAHVADATYASEEKTHLWKFVMLLLPNLFYKNNC